MPDPIGEWYRAHDLDARMWRTIRDAYVERLKDERMLESWRGQIELALRGAEKHLEAAQYVGD